MNSMQTLAQTSIALKSGLQRLCQQMVPAVRISACVAALFASTAVTHAAGTPLYPRIAGSYQAAENYTIKLTTSLRTRTESGSGGGTIRITQSGAKFSYQALDPRGGSLTYTRSGVLTGNALAIVGVFGLQAQPGVKVVRNEFRATGEVMQDRIVIHSYGIVVGVKGTEMESVELTSEATLIGTVTPADVASVQAMVAPAKGGSVTGAGAYSAGSEVSLAASWKPGYYFVNWTQGDTVVGTGPSLSLTADGIHLLQANFAAVGAANYASILQSGAEPTNSGIGFLRAGMTASGSMTAKVIVEGASFSLTGLFDRTWSLQKTIRRTGRSELRVILTLDPATRQLSGSVTALGGGFDAPVAATPLPVHTKTSPAPTTGKFTAVMPVAFVNGVPPIAIGAGYLTINVTATGAFTAAGKLADGKPVSFGAQVATGDAIELYSSLYAATGPSRGSISGVLRFYDIASSSNYLDAALAWFKPEQKAGSFYRDGFEVTLATSGSRYVPPPRGDFVLRLIHAAQNATVRLSGGGLTDPVNITATLSTARSVLADPPNSYKLTFTVNATAGTFSGSFAPFGDARKVSFAGVLNQTAIDGEGFYLGLLKDGQGESGTVKIFPHF